MTSEAILYDDQQKITFKNSNLGNEEVYFNEDLVSDKRVLRGSSSHSWTKGNDKYELIIKLGLFNGKIELLKNEQQIDVIKGKTLDVINGNRVSHPKDNIWIYALKTISKFIGVAIIYSIIAGKKSIFYIEDSSKLIGFITSPIGIGVIVFNIFFIGGCIYAFHKSKYF